MKYISLVTAGLTLGLAACGGGGSSGSNTPSSSSVVAVSSSQPSSAVVSSVSSAPVEPSSSAISEASSVAVSSTSEAPVTSSSDAPASSLPASSAASSVVVVPTSSEASVPSSSIAPSSASESSASESAASDSSAETSESSLASSIAESSSSSLSSSLAESSSAPASSAASETSTSSDASSSAASLSWNIYNADYHPATNGSITLADGSVGEFTAGGLGDYFVDQFDGTVVLDTSAAGANTTTATFRNVVNAEGEYPKYITLVAGVKGNSDGLRVLELEVAMADDGLAGSRLKAILRDDGSNKGVQLEQANGGTTVNSYGVTDMSKFAIYQVAITLTSATRGSVNVYRNGTLMPNLSLSDVTMRATSAVGENFVRFGEVSGSATYKSTIDWLVWTNQAAYSPAALDGLLPAGLGCVYGYGSSDQVESCETVPGASSSSASGGGNSSSASSIDHGTADIRPAKIEGYAAYANVTGGAGGPVITVSTGTELNTALCGIRNGNRTAPVVILVDGTINHGNTTAQGCDTQSDVIEIKNTSNISIIGVGTNALFDEIGIHVRSASNIILQNLHIRNVKKSGSPTSNGGDAIGMESGVDRVWIDHNWLEASGGEKDGYDSLLDMKAGVTNVTVSYNLFNDSSRGGLIGSSDSDNKNKNITFHHNWYKNIEQRTPLIRHANVHMYNNYWSNDDRSKMIHGINSRMYAQALVEGNYFQNVNNPLIASKDSSQPGCWQTNNDNTLVDFIYTRTVENNQAHAIPAIVDGQMQSTCEVSVPYVADLDASANVPAIVMANAGVGIISTDTGGASSSSSSSASSEPSSSGSSSSAPATGSGVILSESFAVDKEVLFSAAHKSLATDSTAPMYIAKSGGNNMTVSAGTLTFGTGGSRLQIGASSNADTTASNQPLGSFDLRSAYRISFRVVAAGTSTAKLQVQVDNNTTGGSASVHSSNSRIYNLAENALPVGEVVVLEQTSGPGTANSHITFRTESGINGITIDDLVIEYIAP